MDQLVRNDVLNFEDELGLIVRNEDLNFEDDLDPK